MKPSILTSTFLIFLTLLITSPLICFANFTLHQIVTDGLIHTICPQTRNPNFCEHILNQFKGKPLFHKPVENIMKMAESKAKATAQNIWGLEKDIKDDKSELKLRYHKCLGGYRHAMNQLQEANRFLHAGNVRAVKEASRFVHAALVDIRSCDQELAREQHDEVPSHLARDNRNFQELCSIILAICDKLRS